jgi:sporulation protein YlmC with PRC-barrel domain
METLNKHKNYKVHPDDPDVRGWNVLIEDGTEVGQVDDLVVDTDSMTVSYLDLVREDHADRKKYHFLIPLTQVNFSRFDKRVRVEADSRQFLNSYPRFTGDIPHDYEDKVRQYYSDSHIRKDPERVSGVYDEEKVYANRTESDPQGRKESPYGAEYERLKRYPENLKEKINVLEKQKHSKEMSKLEMERDIALINEEITQLIARLK